MKKSNFIEKRVRSAKSNFFKVLFSQALSLIAAMHLAILPISILTISQPAQAVSWKSMVEETQKVAIEWKKNAAEFTVKGYKVIFEGLSKEEAAAFSPGRIRQAMRDAMPRAQEALKNQWAKLPGGMRAAGDQSNRAYHSAKLAYGKAFAALSDNIVVKGTKGFVGKALKGFPATVWMFFVLLGAINTYKLVFDYARNPNAIDNFFSQQSDPVGVFSFFTFMLAQGPAAAGFDKLFSLSPKFAKARQSGLSGLMGMSVGALAMSYTSQVLYDPDFKKCSGSFFMEQKSPEPKCDKIYDAMWTRFSWFNEIPGVVSMLLSAVAASVVLSQISAGIVGAGTQLNAIRSLNISLDIQKLQGFTVNYISGSGASWTNTGAFLILNELFDPGIQWAWKNVFDGRGLKKSEATIVDQMLKTKQANWQLETPKNECSAANEFEDCDMDLSASITHFTGQMRQGREVNLGHVMGPYYEWKNKLDGFLGTYLGTERVYSNFWFKLKEGRLLDESKSVGLKRIYPLLGVKVIDPAKAKEDLTQLQSTAPKVAETFQRQLIEQESVKIGEILKNQGSSMSHEEQENLKTLAIGFSKNDAANLVVDPIEAAALSDGQKPSDLIKAHTLLKLNELMPSDYKVLNWGHSKNYVTAMITIKSDLGEPAPRLEKGEGWMRSIEKYSSDSGSIEVNNGMSTKENDFYTPTVTDYSLVGMICGPDLAKGESIAKLEFWKWGYPVQFYPPQIKNSSQNLKAVFTDGTKFDLCQSPTARKYTKDIYRTKIEIEGQDRPVYRGILQYLVQNVRDEFIHASSFTDWWQNNVDPHVEKWENFYQEKYAEIVGDLVKTFNGEGTSKFLNINQEKRSVFNMGVVSNDLFDSMKQEIRLYLLTMGEIYKSSILENKVDKNSKSKIDLLLATDITYPEFLTIKDSQSDFHLLHHLLIQEVKGRPVPFDFDQAYSNWNPALKAGALRHPFKFQIELESMFNDFMKGLKMVTVVKKNDSTLTDKKFEITNPLGLTELNDKLKALEAKIDEVGNQIGASSSPGPDIALPPGNIAKVAANAMGPTAQKAQLKPAQLKAATSALIGLKAVANELVQYGNMVDAYNFARTMQRAEAEGEQESQAAKEAAKAAAKPAQPKNKGYHRFQTGPGN